jgi:hypothetical protein
MVKHALHAMDAHLWIDPVPVSRPKAAEEPRAPEIREALRVPVF